MIAATLLLALSFPQNQNPVLWEAPMSLSVDGPTAEANELATNELYLKLPFADGTPIEHPHPEGKPYFSTSGSNSPPWIAPYVAIDAFSTDLNYLAVTSGGQINQTALSYEYAGLALSVTKTSGSEPLSGSVFLQQAGPYGADIFEYMFTGSTIGNGGELVLAINESQVKLFEPPMDDPEITALDLYSALMVHPEETFHLHNDFGGVIFSVTKDSAKAKDAQGEFRVPNEWFEHPVTGEVYRSGGSLIAVDWNGSAWGTPYLFASPKNLGLAGPNEARTYFEDDVDLTAVVWHKQNPANYLLFSSDSETADPLLFVSLGSSMPLPNQAVLPGPVPLQTETGTLASDKMKLKVGVDKIDALSAFDPRNSFQTIIAEPTDQAVGLYGGFFRTVQYPTPSTPDPDLITGMMLPAGSTVQGSVALLLGRVPGATPTLLATYSMPAAGSILTHTISDVAPVTGNPYQVQWLETTPTFEPIYRKTGWKEIIQ